MVLAESEVARALLEAARWKEARVAFEAALSRQVSVEDLLGLAEALWWLGEVPASIDHYERAYAASRDQGDFASACRAAIYLVLSYKGLLGNEAAANGWLARAETSAEQGKVGELQGWLWCMQSYLAYEHDTAKAIDFAYLALDFAIASGDRDLELVARADLGGCLTKAGRLEEGFRLIDESMAAVTAGEHTRLDTVVFVCCVMLTACELASDLQRANQWSRVAGKFVDTYGCPFLHAECRAFYGGVLVSSGNWAEAERELQSAIKLTEGSFPSVYVLGRTFLADLRLRQGRFEDAESLLAGLEQELAAALPFAVLNLAHGRPQMARALLDRVLRNTNTENIVTVRALELLVDVHLASGDGASAREALSRLETATSQREWPEAAARLNMAKAKLACMLDGDAAAALGFYEKAMAGFSRLGLPFETARARLAIADVASESNRDLAAVEARGALAAFTELGANADADAASALLRRLGVPTRPGPKHMGLLTRREQEVLRLLSSGLSNPEIAERLVISRKTAAHHVSSLLSKLNVRNRAEAVAYAARNGNQN